MNRRRRTDDKIQSGGHNEIPPDSLSFWTGKENEDVIPEPEHTDEYEYTLKCPSTITIVKDSEGCIANTNYKRENVIRNVNILENRKVPIIRLNCLWEAYSQVPQFGIVHEPKDKVDLGYRVIPSVIDLSTAPAELLINIFVYRRQIRIPYGNDLFSLTVGQAL